MLMAAPPTQHPPPGLCQDDSAQIILLIVSTCVDSQLRPSFPQTSITGYCRAAGRWREPLSLKWTLDFQALPPFLINPVPTARPPLHACPVVDDIFESSCLEQRISFFGHPCFSLYPWPCPVLVDLPGEGEVLNLKSHEKRNYLALTSESHPAEFMAQRSSLRQVG